MLILCFEASAVTFQAMAPLIFVFLDVYGTQTRKRKRKDSPGELSKGAIRAQRAAARTKAMRAEWMNTSILLNEMNRQSFMEGIGAGRPSYEADGCDEQGYQEYDDHHYRYHDGSHGMEYHVDSRQPGAGLHQDDHPHCGHYHPEPQRSHHDYYHQPEEPFSPLDRGESHQSSYFLPHDGSVEPLHSRNMYADEIHIGPAAAPMAHPFYQGPHVPYLAGPQSHMAGDHSGQEDMEFDHHHHHHGSRAPDLQPSYGYREEDEGEPSLFPSTTVTHPPPGGYDFGPRDIYHDGDGHALVPPLEQQQLMPPTRPADIIAGRWAREEPLFSDRWDSNVRQDVLDYHNHHHRPSVEGVDDEHDVLVAGRAPVLGGYSYPQDDAHGEPSSQRHHPYHHPDPHQSFNHGSLDGGGGGGGGGTTTNLFPRRPSSRQQQGHQAGESKTSLLHQAVSEAHRDEDTSLPSEGMNFGTETRLFDEIWEPDGGAAPADLFMDEDMEDYQEAVREQEAMEMDAETDRLEE